ncbi:MAG: universal stress protein [Ferruginibacter sp.]|nr:universal stress protein [Cytophagales bacterium]
MKTIVCPTDFSPCAENAVHYADQLAQRTQARLILCHNLPPTNTPRRVPSGAPSQAVLAMDEPDGNSLKERTEKIRKEVRASHPDTAVLYESTIKYGITQDGIPSLAEAEQADLIVMGTDGIHSLEGTVAGTISAQMVEKATCPVLIIPRNASFHWLKHIVVATDLGENSSPEMNIVFELAQLFGAEIHFFHILDREMVGARATAWEGFTKWKQQFSYEKIAFYTNTREDLQEAIVEFSRVHNADLLVMIHHPRSFWKLNNSQTKLMAYHTQVPLLAIHYRA